MSQCDFSDNLSEPCDAEQSPCKRYSLRKFDKGAVEQRAASGLLSAMKLKNKPSPSPEQTHGGFQVAQDLNPSSCNPSLAVLLANGTDGDADEEDNEEDDEGDSASIFIPARSKRCAKKAKKTVKPSKKPKAPGKSSTDKATAGSKRKQEDSPKTLPVSPQRHYALYHDEAKRRNKSPKILFQAESQSLEVLIQKPWLHDQNPKVQVSGLHYGKPGQTFYFSSPLSQVVINDEMPAKERKRFFIYTPTEAIKEAMQTHVSNVHKLFPPTRNINDCMLHPSPGGLRKDGKYHQVIACNYQWKDQQEIHNIGVNFGIVALIVNHFLTPVQKEGFIEDAWHLSHLCGNWICCNWRHHTIEPGPVNISRNACFASLEPCKHIPRCMKDKKVALNLPAATATSNRIAAAANLSMDIYAEEAEKREQEEKERKLVEEQRKKERQEEDEGLADEEEAEKSEDESTMEESGDEESDFEED